MDYVFRFLLQSYLNPVVVILYLVGFRDLFKEFGINAYTRVGVNNERLNIVWYLLLAPVIYLSWLVVDFVFLKSFNGNLTIGSCLGGEYHWVEYVPFVVSAITLKAYSSQRGMEGNIMGFIFAPLLFGAISIFGFFHFKWVVSVIVSGGAA